MQVTFHESLVIKIDVGLRDDFIFVQSKVRRDSGLHVVRNQGAVIFTTQISDKIQCGVPITDFKSLDLTARFHKQHHVDGSGVREKIGNFLFFLVFVYFKIILGQAFDQVAFLIRDCHVQPHGRDIHTDAGYSLNSFFLPLFSLLFLRFREYRQ